MQLIQKGGAQKIENKSVFQNRVRNDTMMTQSPKKQGSRSPDKKPRLTQKNDDEPSPGESDEFVDIDDELIQDDEYGDYDDYAVYGNYDDYDDYKILRGLCRF